MPEIASLFDGKPSDAARIAGARGDFPALSEHVEGKPLVYLDSAATALKPRAVVDAVARALAFGTGAVHRGLHGAALRATTTYEAARETVARFLGAGSAEEIVFVRGATEAMNLFVESWARPRLGPGDEVVVTEQEHHSSFLPWRRLCERTGATLVVVPLGPGEQIALDALERAIGPRTRAVAVAHVSNVLGAVLDVRAVAERAHAVGAVLIADGAQAAAHLPVDVRALGCDAYSFSGHKLYGPSGIGVLWARPALLDAMEPYQLGGQMIRSVRLDGVRFKDGARKLEAGTPNVEGAVGLAAALDYVERLGRGAIEAHDRALGDHALALLGGLPGVRILGPKDTPRAGLVSFVVDGVHAHDLATILDADRVAVRAGHLCAEPLVRKLGVPAVTRASFGVYTSRADLDALAAGILRAQEVLR